MISTHPYNTWPLHVKLFSEEAIKAWNAVSATCPDLPPGLKCSVEVEGVDGRSGKVGTGRSGEIEVNDGLCFIACEKWRCR